MRRYDFFNSIKQVKYQHVGFLLSRLSILLTGLILSILTTRFLGPVGRGEFFYIYSTQMLIGLISSLGLQTSNTYLVTLNSTLLNRILINSVWVAVIFCSLMAYLVILCLLKVSVHSSAIWFLLCLAPLNLFYLFAVSLFSGLKDIKRLNHYQIALNVLTLLAVILSGAYTHNLCIMLASIAVAWLIVDLAIFKALYQLRNTVQNSYMFSYSFLKTHFSYSSKSYFIGIATYFSLRVNIFLLQKYALAEELGFYSVAAQIGDVLALLPQSISLLLFPELLKNSKIIHQTMKQFSLIMFALCIVTWLCAPYFITYFYGNEFKPAIEILNYLLPGCFFFGIISLLSQYFATKKFPKMILVIWAAGIAFNIILSYILIPFWGSCGAAIALSLSYAFILILFGAYLFYEKQMNEYSYSLH